MPKETPIFSEHYEVTTQTLENILGITFSRSDEDTYTSNSFMGLVQLVNNSIQIRTFLECTNHSLPKYIKWIDERRERLYQDKNTKAVHLGLSILIKKLKVTEVPGYLAVLTLEALSADELNQLKQMKEAADTDTADALMGIQHFAQGFLQGMIAQKSLE